MKVFGIGLSRTGTSSLTRALGMLGLRARHYFFDLDSIDDLDAATDTPIARAYKLLDHRYPGSRFVLTVRDEAGWLRSCAEFFAEPPEPGGEEEALALDLYGCIGFDAELFRAAYARHQADVMAYFRDRREDLLVMDICTGEGFERLCPFLGLPVPPEPFPHYNSIDWALRLRERVRP
jgi:hypothetical protein